MRKLLLGLLLLVPTTALGQLVALPQPSTTAPQKASLTWVPNTPGTGQVQCSTANPCTFEVYRCQGTASTCTSTSTNWNLITTTASNVFAYIDNPGVGTWSYSIVAVLVSDGNNSSASNIVTLTLTNPLIPAPVTAAGTAG